MIEYTNELKKIFKFSEIEAKKLNSKYIDTEHFILSLLKYNSEVSSILKKYNVSYDKYLREIEEYKKETIVSNMYSLNLKKIIDNACYYDKDNKESIVSVNSVFLSILENDEGIGVKTLEYLNVNLDSLYSEIKKKVQNTKNLYIREIGIDFNLKAKLNEFERTIGRDKEIDRLIEILARKNKNNPILVGEAGVGKTAIVEELSKRIVSGNVPSFLKDTTIMSVNMSNLVAGTKYRGEFEEKLGKVIKELESNKNIIIFIDEMHTLVGAGGAEGAIDASNILKPVLARNTIRCIGATTLNEYKKYIEKDKALDRRFQKIYIEEPSTNETLNILKKIKKDYEKYHNVKLNNSVLETIVKLSKRYIKDRYEPDRSIDILDEVCAKAGVKENNKDINKLINQKKKVIKLKNQLLKDKNYKEASKIKKEEKILEEKIKQNLKVKEQKIVTTRDLKEVLEYKSNSYVKELNKNMNYNKIINNLKNNIIGQDKIIEDILFTIKNNINEQKPLSILFNGPTGVGKTMTAKEISKELRYNFIKLDMSEYSSDMSINKIIGSAQGYVGYEDVNTVFEKIKDKPNSLILLDEVDKASKKVLNLFLNLLDEGYLTNSKGEKLYFNNSIFLLTTNNLKSINNFGFVKEKRKIDYDTFNKEFINRIDYIFEFNNLTKENILTIINKELIKYNKKLKEEQINSILLSSEYEIYGARKIKNLISKKILRKNVYN